MAKQKTSEPLTGTALLQKVKTLGHPEQDPESESLRLLHGHERWWGARQPVAVSAGSDWSGRHCTGRTSRWAWSGWAQCALPNRGASEWQPVDRDRVYPANGAPTGWCLWAGTGPQTPAAQTTGPCRLRYDRRFAAMRPRCPSSTGRTGHSALQ